MKPLDVVKRHLELTRPVPHNMWDLFDMTIANLDIRGTRISYEDYAQLESDYNQYLHEGRWPDEST